MMGGRRRRCLDDTFRTFFRRRWWAPPPMDFLDKGRTRQPLSTPPYEPAAKPGHAWPTGRRGLHVMWLATATQRNYLTRVRIRTLLTNPRICWRGQHRRPFSHRPVNIHCCKWDTRSMPRHVELPHGSKCWWSGPFKMNFNPSSNLSSNFISIVNGTTVEFGM